VAGDRQRQTSDIVRDDDNHNLYFVACGDQRFGPFAFKQAQQYKARLDSQPDFRRRYEQTPAFRRLRRELRRTSTPAYRAALEKQRERLRDFERPAVPKLPAAPLGNPWPATPAEVRASVIEAYLSRSRKAVITYIRTGLNRAQQRTASRAGAAARRADTAAKRQRVCELTAVGMTNAKIAASLGLSVRQVQRLKR